MSVRLAVSTLAVPIGLISLAACGDHSEAETPLYAAPTVNTDDLCLDIGELPVVTDTSARRWTILDSAPDESTSRFANAKRCRLDGTTPSGNFTITAEITNYGARSEAQAMKNASEKPAELCDSDIGGDVKDGICTLDYSEFTDAPRVTRYKYLPGTSTVIEASVSSIRKEDVTAVTETADVLLEVLTQVAKRDG
jgi:hypothetical protein